MLNVLNLCLKTNNSFEIPFEELVDCIFDRRDELLPHIEKLHERCNFFNGCYRVNLTDFKTLRNDDNTCICITGSFDINDPLYLRLTAQESYTQEDGDIYDTDGFLDIKCDRESLTKAINDILNGTIPLHNRDNVITQESCTYALIDSE
jgi:hypothetical protein